MKCIVLADLHLDLHLNQEMDSFDRVPAEDFEGITHCIIAGDLSNKAHKQWKRCLPWLFMDETTIPKLAPGTGKTRTSQMFAMLRDDRSFAGNLPPLVIYETSDTRTQWKIHKLLYGFSGIVQTDAYAGYGTFGKPGTPVENVIPVKCWAHARRNFTDEYEFNKTPDAKEIIDIIAELYDEEDVEKIRGKPPLIRQLHREAFSRPILDRLRQRLIAMSSNHLGKNKMGQAIRYLLLR